MPNLLDLAQDVLFVTNVVGKASERRGPFLSRLDMFGGPTIVSFVAGKEAMNSFRGMPASRTAITMISFSS